jgi:hypothetical protein
LSGPSRRPDPRTHAYRQDLADAALAGTVIASHYAEPLERELKHAADLLSEPDGGDAIARLEAGARLLMLDCTRGWAWGYAGPERLVGYVAHADLVG